MNGGPDKWRRFLAGPGTSIPQQSYTCALFTPNWRICWRNSCLITRPSGRTTAGDELGAGEKTLQGCFPSRIYLGTWFLCSESPWFPVLGVLHAQTRPDPYGNSSLKASMLSGCVLAGLEPPGLHLLSWGVD